MRLRPGGAAGFGGGASAGGACPLACHVPPLCGREGGREPGLMAGSAGCLLGPRPAAIIADACVRAVRAVHVHNDVCVRLCPQD
eukprot:COSAG01_NODE_2213_length_8163_cov_18.627327_6_plen_84_part_00